MQYLWKIRKAVLRPTFIWMFFISIVPVGGYCLLLASSFVFWMIDIDRTHNRIDRGITKILYQTDHVEFLKACRDYRRTIIQEQGSGKSLFSRDDPEFQKLPAVILAIEPGWVCFREDDVLQFQIYMFINNRKFGC